MYWNYCGLRPSIQINRSIKKKQHFGKVVKQLYLRGVFYSPKMRQKDGITVVLFVRRSAAPAHACTSICMHTENLIQIIQKPLNLIVVKPHTLGLYHSFYTAALHAKNKWVGLDYPETPAGRC